MINLDATQRNTDWIKTLNADFPLGITLEEAQHAQDQGLPVTLAPNWPSIVVKDWDEDLHPRDEAGKFTDSDTGLTRSEANARQLFREHGWTPTKMQENLRGLIERAKESGAYEEGLHWYQNAHDTAQGFADKYGVTIEQAAGVIAVLSPDTRWGRNVAEADRLLQLVTSPTWTYTAEESDARYTKALKMLSEARDEMSQEKYEKALARAEELNMAGQALIGTHNTADLSAHDLAPYARIGTYYGNVEKAIEVARGDLSVIRGNKVEAFVDNILHPDTSDKVTIDTHMVRAIVSDIMIDDKVLATAIRTDARYNILAEQVTKVASELGVSPSQAQAIAWIQWSRVEHPDERNVIGRAATAAAKKKEIDEEEIFTDEQRLIFDLIWQGFTEAEIDEIAIGEKEWDESQHLRDEAGRFTDTGQEMSQALGKNNVRTPIVTMNNPKVAKTVTDWERTHAQTGGNEHGIIVMSDGSVTEVEGTESSIKLDDEVLQNIEGSILSHSHPDPDIQYPLSESDVLLAIRSNLSEVRAVTSGGYVSSLKAPGGSWDNYTPKEEYASGRRDGARWLAQQAIYEGWPIPSLSLDQEYTGRVNSVLAKIAAETGATYTYEKVS